MNVYVYPTDPDWYGFLSQQRGLDEVNFWRPGGEQPFRQLEPGDLLLFRLRSPENAIAGGGIFTHFSFAPLAQVWEAFGPKNGTRDYQDLVRIIARHRRLRVMSHAGTAVIGCIILSSPFFLPRDRWIGVPADYPINSPQGYRYEGSTSTGQYLRAAVEEALVGSRGLAVHEPAAGSLLEEAVEFRETLTRRRLGQGAFSLLVADAYEKRCVVTGEKTYPVLEAAHIKAVARGGAHRIDNGLLLRADIHKLFDSGYVTITPDGEFRVSERLAAEWHNGVIYYDLHRRTIRTPVAARFAPRPEFLEWHRDEVFKG